MKSNLLKSKRIERCKTQSFAASLIEKSVDSYAKKERGEVSFTPAEISALTNGFGLTFDEFNDIFLTRNYSFVSIQAKMPNYVTKR